MLPFHGLPEGWTIGKLGNSHLETFKADNLYEKIDGRAESFLQYGVIGMACACYHPVDDPANELQLYIFEMADALKALGKYGSEKPDGATPIPIGDEGYTTAGSALFYSGRYYTQIVSTLDDPKFAACALELAKRVAAIQKPATPGPRTPGATPVSNTATSAIKPVAVAPEQGVPSHAAANPNEATNSAHTPLEVSPATYFALLPAQGRQGDFKYIAQDVFGYSFLSDVFMAEYKVGDATWQGFLRPYHDALEAKSMLDKYMDGVKKDGAEVKKLVAEGADEIIVSKNIGLIDVVFRKGNTLAGANGATRGAPAEAFARELAKSLPAAVQRITGGR
jgi:hypothetical protein